MYPQMQLANTSVIRTVYRITQHLPNVKYSYKMKVIAVITFSDIQSDEEGCPIGAAFFWVSFILS